MLQAILIISHQTVFCKIILCYDAFAFCLGTISDGYTALKMTLVAPVVPCMGCCSTRLSHVLAMEVQSNRCRAVTAEMCACQHLEMALHASACVRAYECMFRLTATCSAGRAQLNLSHWVCHGVTEARIARRRGCVCAECLSVGSALQPLPAFENGSRTVYHNPASNVYRKLPAGHKSGHHDDHGDIDGIHT